MSVDLQQLAIDRGGSDRPEIVVRRHLLTRYILPGGLLVGFAALVAWASWSRLFPPRPVTVVPVFASQRAARVEGTPLFKAAGWVEPRPTPIGVAALSTGVVDRLLVVEDQAVKAGDPVAELVKTDAELAVQRAEADLRLREAERDEVEAASQAATVRLEQPVHLEAALGEAEAELAEIRTTLAKLPFDIRQAEAARDTAQKEYEGKRAAGDAIAGVVLVQVKGRLDAAIAEVEGLAQSRDSLLQEETALVRRRDALKSQLELLVDEKRAKAEAEAQARAATARVRQAEVALAEAELRLRRMTVQAPVDGRIYQLIGHPGSYVGGGARELHGHDGSTVVTMYRPDMLQVRVDVRFEDLPKVSLGQSARIENPALQTPLIGSVLFVSSEADIQKNTLQVKVALESPPPVLKPEMLVDVTFLAPRPAREVEEAATKMRIFVPRQLVVRGESGTFVWVADLSDGVARKAVIETGQEDSGDFIEVTTGLEISSRIIARGTDGLRDGDRIRVTGEEAALGSGDPGSAFTAIPAGEES